MISAYLTKLPSRTIRIALFVILVIFSCKPISVRGVDGSFTVGTNLVVETRLAIEKDSDNVIVITAYIDRVKDKDTGVTQPIPGGIGSYSATATAGSGLQILQVRGVSPYVNPIFNAGTGVFSVSTVSNPQQPNNSAVAKLVIRLTGGRFTACTLGIAFQQIKAASVPGLNVPEESPHSLSFLRGDTNSSGGVNIVDALFIAQNLVGLRPNINYVNAASVRQDGSTGDSISIVDALFIAQCLVGIRDDSYVLK